MATIHFFQKDFNKSYLSTTTIALSLSTYPFMLCTVWNVLRALPLTKYGLVNAHSTKTYFKPRIINLLSIFFYAFPFVFAGPQVFLITLYTTEITQIYNEHNNSFLAIISGNLEAATIYQLNIEASARIASIQERGEKVLILSRLISFGYWLYILALFLMMLFGHLFVLQAVRYQLRTFRQVLQPQIPLTLSILQLAEARPELRPTPASAPFKTPSGAYTIETQRKTPPALGSFSRWLPSLRHDQNFLEQSVSSNSFDDSGLKNQQPWQISNHMVIQSQCKALKTYQVNLVWQVIGNSTIMVVIAVLDMIIYSDTTHDF
ncbi:uncharacterized protein PGTG_16953 [Puccinia graminis f. sp. tritici CRL 75-36-700-3]|uniref:Uncharacterized protein n=1 Tax=Puccinia graminis f. sp. tritici (strain CRL 75-36-700-3 / race SCCL) TaxID=418459 RepID=E3L3G6_PUCGT|nr:uncharacterized protein PGTG_16953 [Puccinia graminis f. sp. tritici CRL 75-36-700-3]EFP91091.1 hypothetical protein PGTG_16953 [Puccinia graminis f. sp. tritici CRL 75-36-700-3]